VSEVQIEEKAVIPEVSKVDIEEKMSSCEWGRWWREGCVGWIEFKLNKVNTEKKAVWWFKREGCLFRRE
jgi:hypothetical protein